MSSVGVPSLRSMTSAFGDYGMGVAGGLVYALASGFFGSGILGSLVAPLAAGSIVKGQRGSIISTVAGFYAGQQLLASMGTNSGTSSGEQVM